MFELKTNEEIGKYLKDLILTKYSSCRQFCIAYVDLTIDFSNDINDQRSEEIRKLTNRLSQILKGKKSIQTYDLPVFSELLDVSCEQMLSAGVNCLPKTNRRTNYNIAFSTDERDWIPKMREKQVEMLNKLYKEEELPKIYEWAKVNDLNELTVAQASALIAKRKGNK